MSVMVAYASHLPRHVSIAGASFTVCILDTLCALLAGVAIFAIAFSNGLEPGAGPGLVFQTMPIAFGSITGGYVIGVMFFLLLLFAACSVSPVRFPSMSGPRSSPSADAPFSISPISSRPTSCCPRPACWSPYSADGSSRVRPRARNSLAPSIRLKAL